VTGEPLKIFRTMEGSRPYLALFEQDGDGPVPTPACALGLVFSTVLSPRTARYVRALGVRTYIRLSRTASELLKAGIVYNRCAWSRDRQS